MDESDKKRDKGKATNIPMLGMVGVLQVERYGREKHGEAGWRNRDKYPPVGYVDAAFRHLIPLCEDVCSKDPESGIPHAYHFAWNALMVAYSVVVGD